MWKPLVLELARGSARLVIAVGIVQLEAISPHKGMTECDLRLANGWGSYLMSK